MHMTLASVAILARIYPLTASQAHRIVATAAPLYNNGRLTLSAIQAACRILYHDYDLQSPRDRVATTIKARNMLHTVKDVYGDRDTSTATDINILCQSGATCTIRPFARHHLLTISDEHGHPIADGITRARHPRTAATLRLHLNPHTMFPTAQQWYGLSQVEREDLTVRLLTAGHLPVPCPQCQTFVTIPTDDWTWPQQDHCRHVDCTPLNPDHVIRAGGRLDLQLQDNLKYYLGEDGGESEPTGTSTWYCEAHNKHGNIIGAGWGPTREKARAKLTLCTPPPF
ncbi:MULTISPECIES: hypothetical protein [unclassified Crossiella]|uniref:hypothetical protein n=1 Tax=unclassified Crossiella TaxID=2620835 RepID=UPI002494615D|nr:MULTISPECIES: hypothetical protein [unclassified Crossiella]